MRLDFSIAKFDWNSTAIL